MNCLVARAVQGGHDQPHDDDQDDCCDNRGKEDLGGVDHGATVGKHPRGTQRVEDQPEHHHEDDEPQHQPAEGAHGPASARSAHGLAHGGALGRASGRALRLAHGLGRTHGLGGAHLLLPVGDELVAALLLRRVRQADTGQRGSARAASHGVATLVLHLDLLLVLVLSLSLALVEDELSHHIRVVAQVGHGLAVGGHDFGDVAVGRHLVVGVVRSELGGHRWFLTGGHFFRKSTTELKKL